MQIRGQAFGGYIHAKSGHTLVYEVVVNNVPFTAIDDIIKVFDDDGIYVRHHLARLLTCNTPDALLGDFVGKARRSM